ncbi:hypothetical protein [Epilithonimonas xixisoli]|uniref:Uncharacterized protein n=1 Tax=Epilithonimonas xixisoli TaxID=1476462 RepID=A0A4R8IEB1_9FLAO|nr:hypothetical protein [Epilithonimonas xixisoli]TDX83990.1 hypothetical protein B0I22_1578 [Epilithonimonas xixisoli]
MKNNLEEKRREITRILGKGFHFEIAEKIEIKPKGLLSFFKKKEYQIIPRAFQIKEPTLSVLDRISLESINLIESEFNDLKTFADQKRFSRKHYKLMAKIIAIAVAGPYGEESEITEFKNLFFKYLKPSDLYNIVQMIDITSNLMDFINSTRLVTAANVLAETDLVEKKELQD